MATPAASVLNSPTVPAALRARRVRLEGELAAAQANAAQPNAAQPNALVEPAAPEPATPAATTTPRETPAFSEGMFAVDEEGAPLAAATQPVATQPVATQPVATQPATTAATTPTTSPLSWQDMFASEQEPVTPESTQRSPSTPPTDNSAQLLTLVEAMRSEIAELKTARTAATSATPSAALTMAELQLTPEEQQTYAQSLPIIARVAGAVAAKQIAGLKQEIEELRGNLNTSTTEVRSAVAKSASQAFEHSLRATIPDFQARMMTPEFQTYLTKPVPFGGGTKIREVLLKAFKERNAAVIVEAFKDFEATVQTTPTTPPITAFSQPNAAATPAPNTAAPVPGAAKKPILAMSKRNEAFRKLRDGELTAEEMRVISNIYAIADQEGRVDYNR